MGCASGQKQETQNLRLQTKNGILRVTVVSAKIQHQTSTFFSMDPYIKTKISNQTARTNVLKKGGRQPVFNESFEFFINSCYKSNGRTLEIQLWDQNKTSDSLIGFGIADIDPILNSKQPKTDLRVFLNYELKPAGIINTIVQFREEPIQLLNFRFETASIRRKTSTLSNMNCYVKTTIGEEILTTKKQKDTKEMPPVWADQIVTFNVFKTIKNCLIQVYDDKQLVGQCTLLVQDLLKQRKQRMYDQGIDFKQAIAGSLRFQTILGPNPQFSDLKRDYKRKITESKIPEVQQSKLKNEEKKQTQKLKQEPKTQSKQGK